VLFGVSFFNRWSINVEGFKAINQQKQAIVSEWDKLLQRFIDRAIGQWRRRLEWVVPQQDEQSEHLM